MTGNPGRITPQTPFVRSNEIFRTPLGHVAILTGFPFYGIAVGTVQPFSVRVVDQGIPKYTEVTGGTELALSLKRKIGVFSGSHIVERSHKQLVPLFGPSKLQ
jgi:hypothetical protein